MYGQKVAKLDVQTVKQCQHGIELTKKYFIYLYNPTCAWNIWVTIGPSLVNLRKRRTLWWWDKSTEHRIIGHIYPVVWKIEFDLDEVFHVICGGTSLIVRFQSTAVRYCSSYQLLFGRIESFVAVRREFDMAFLSSLIPSSWYVQPESSCESRVENRTDICGEYSFSTSSLPCVYWRAFFVVQRRVHI